MEWYDGRTSDGREVFCKIDPEHHEALVEYDGEKYIRFLFNPDFPQDAKAFFQALCNVQHIIVDE